MKKVKILAVFVISLLLVYFLFGNTILNYLANYQQSNSISYQEHQVKYRWEPILFKEIDERIKDTSITGLREKKISPDSVEIRIWSGFSLEPLKGIIFEKNDGNWVANYIPPINDISKSSKEPYLLPSPRSGWATFWEKLEGLDILTLPDASEVGDIDVYPDAKVVIVEIKHSNSYRNYMYSGLKTAKSKESKKVLEICHIISNELVVPFC